MAMVAQTIPFIIQNDDGRVDPAHLVDRERTRLRRLLVEQGAVLLRGFDVGGVDGFNAIVRAMSGEPLSYSERSSPRSTIKGLIYTSTDYPPDEEIFLHNENSYQMSWPLTLFFHCMQEPATLGATPLADIRQVFDLIDPAVREEFARRKWMVRRNFGSSIGIEWQYVFNSEDPRVVEDYCRGRGITCEWFPEGRLRTTAVREAIHRHPLTGSMVWFNHITFFHVTTLGKDVCEALLSMLPEEDLPTNSYYGDGQSIPDDVVEHLRDCYRAASARFDWQLDDVLVVDNMTAAHGRERYTGPRKIAVAMAEPHPRLTTRTRSN
jgi:hypothetical protein